MRGFLAALYKDLKLFLSGAGWLAVILPLLLLPALLAGVGDLTGVSFVRSFPIAVRDEDGTIMSRSLISQLRDIELFSEVTVLEEDETDGEALADGAAAVVTIPRDFFYDLYTMDDCPVDVTLNDSMGLESTLFETVFTSVMGIIRVNHAAGLGVYTFVYGEITPELARAMHAQSGNQLLRDALGRQRVFEAAEAGADLVGAMLRRVLTCVLGVTALFFALSAVKTLPEELDLGVLPRLRALGGGAAGFLFSKFLIAFILTLPVLALASVLSDGGFGWLVLLDGLLLMAAFGLLLAVAAWSGSARSAQRWGNLILLLSLALGGTLWPRTRFPGALAFLGKLTLPYYASLGLEARAAGMGMAESLPLLWPLLLMGVLGLGLAAVGLRRRRGRTAESDGAPAEDMPENAVSPAFGKRLAGLGTFKLWAVSGGTRGLAAVLIAALLCGAAAASVSGGGASALRLVVCDQDGTELSRALVERLMNAEGVELAELSEDAGRVAVLTGEREGLILIGEGYGRALTRGDDTPLYYESAAASLSAQGAREVVAGAAMAQRRRLEAASLAGEMMGRALTEEERARLDEEIQAAEDGLPALYHIAHSDGAAGLDPFAPGPMSFAALAALFTLLTAAAWCGSAESRGVERRMASLPRGRALSYVSDLMALTALGFFLMLAVLAPGGGLARAVAPAGLTSLCFAALARMLTRLTAAEGRIDALAPFLALLLCLLGGCFLDFSILSPTMAAATLVSPAGLAVRAAEGSLAAGLTLLAEGGAFALLGRPRA